MSDDTEETTPGLEQGAEPGVFVIGPKAAKRSLERSQQEANDNAQRVVGEINAETEQTGPQDTIADGS